MKKQMKKGFKKCWCYGLLFVMLLSFAGCGGASQSADAVEWEATNGSNADFSYNSYEYAEEAIAEEAPAEEAVEMESGEKKAQDTGRKLIKTVDMNVETRDFEGLLPLIEQKVAELGGYIENSEVYNGSTYHSYKDLRWASLTIRVPQEKLDGFIQDMEGVSNVTNCSQNVTDVTLTYVDLESHKKALKVEQDRLLELLEIAETVEDIITIESRLSEVRYEIESMEAQLRSYDNKVNYSTVYMYIDEVEVLTPVVEETAGERIVRGFSESVKDVCEGIKEFCIEFIISLPYLVVWGIIITVIIWIIVKLSRRSMRKAVEKNEKEREQRQNQVIQNIEKAEQQNANNIK